MDELGVGYYDVWVGTFTSETKAWHREELVDSTLDADDWLVVADIDELHQFPGVVSFAAATDADATQHQGSIAQYLRSIEQKHRPQSQRCGALGRGPDHALSDDLSDDLSDASRSFSFSLSLSGARANRSLAKTALL